jgi:ABC-type lipoprotein release transport system permease subunit
MKALAARAMPALRSFAAKLRPRRREGLRTIDTIRVAWGHIRETRIFFWANVVAIGVGILLVVVMLSMAVGLSRYVDSAMRSDISAEMIEVQRPRTSDSAAPLTLQTIAAFRAIPGARDARPSLWSSSADLYLPQYGHTAITIIPAAGRDDPELTRNEFLAGSASSLRREAMIVIPASVANDLGIVPPASAAGRRLILQVQRFGPETMNIPVTVAAVARRTREHRCFVPLPLLERIRRWQDTPKLTQAAVFAEPARDPSFAYELAHVYARSVDDVRDLRRQLETRGYTTASILDSVKRYHQIMLIAGLVLTSLGLIALFTGSVSIFNAAYAAVMRRMREFAIFKTYGATRRAIMALVLTEALITALVSGAFGFLLGSGICLLLQRLVPKDVKAVLFPIEWWLAAAAFGTACLASLLASIIPALRAARLSPTEAMRT